MISFRKTLFIHTKFPKYISSFQTISFHNIPMQLTEKEKERYNRQIQLDESEEKGQT